MGDLTWAFQLFSEELTKNLPLVSLYGKKEIMLHFRVCERGEYSLESQIRGLSSGFCHSLV